MYGLPRWVRTAPTSSTAHRPGCAHALDSRLLQRTPRAIAAAASERADVGGEMNRIAPTVAARAGSSRSGGPRRTTEPEPSASKASSRSLRHSSRNCVRDPKRVARGAGGRRSRRPGPPGAGVERRAEGGVVANAKVATEPDDLCHGLQTACVTRPLRSALSALRGAHGRAFREIAQARCRTVERRSGRVTTVSVRGPSTSGRATPVSTGVTRPIQSDERAGE